ncbi:MAG: hypothetical protein PUD80_01895, partial [Firmicutes bacterium]|nr:hypothetical protein [Bacillota bacterium]
MKYSYAYRRMCVGLYRRGEWPETIEIAGVAKLRQYRIIGQGDSARDFDTSESMENAGILDVYPIFHTARLGQKIRQSPQLLL